MLRAEEIVLPRKEHSNWLANTKCHSWKRIHTSMQTAQVVCMYMNTHRDTHTNTSIEGKEVMNLKENKREGSIWDAVEWAKRREKWHNYNIISNYLTKNTYIQGFREFQAWAGNNFLCTWCYQKNNVSIWNHGVSTSRQPPAMSESM